MTAWQDGHYWNCFNSIRMWVSFAPRRNCSRARNNKQRPQWTPLFITAAAAWIKDVQRRFPHLTNERTHTHTWSLNNHNNKKEEREKETKGNKKKNVWKISFPPTLWRAHTTRRMCCMSVCVSEVYKWYTHRSRHHHAEGGKKERILLCNNLRTSRPRSRLS